MLHRFLSTWSWFGSDRRGFCLGTCAMISTMVLVYAGGVQASLSLGPGGDFPRFRDVFLYAVSHDDLPSLLVSVALLLLVGLTQERRWGTVVFLALSILTMVFLPLVYTLVLHVLVGEPSRICGYSAVEMALFTAQCRQVTQRRLLRCVPVWFLPWCLLLLCMLLLPGTPALLHFCAISIGHNYNHSFMKTLQELEQVNFLNFIPESAFISTSARLSLPTYSLSARSPSSHQVYAAPSPAMHPSVLNHHPWLDDVSFPRGEGSASMTEAEQLEEQMLRAAMFESLHGVTEDAKIELPKSSVSSLRLQQLEKMGFPTDKAVVALAASKQLDGAISLLIDDSVGEQAVVVSKGKTPQTHQSTLTN